MGRTKTPDLHKTDADRLRKYTEQMKDMELPSDKRAQARDKRAQLMLSLRRAGHSFAAMVEPSSTQLTVVREIVVVMPPSTPSVTVRAPGSNERVKPEPLPSEFVFGDLNERQVNKLKGLSAAATQLRGPHAKTDFKRLSSAQLDVALAYLHFEQKHKPTDLARALETSQSLVRQRMRRGKEILDGGKLPEWITQADVDALISEIAPEALSARESA